MQDIPTLFPFILSRVRNRELAEDLHAETLSRIHEHGKSFRGESKFTTWVHAIAFNLILQYWRHHNSILILPIDDALIVKADEQLDSNYALTELTQLIVDVMAGWKHAGIREVVERRLFLDEQFKEIAVAVGRPCSTVKVMWFRGSARLRRALAPVLGESLGTRHYHSAGVRSKAGRVSRAFRNACRGGM